MQTATPDTKKLSNCTDRRTRRFFTQLRSLPPQSSSAFLSSRVSSFVCEGHLFLVHVRRESVGENYCTAKRLQNYHNSRRRKNHTTSPAFASVSAPLCLLTVCESQISSIELHTDANFKILEKKILCYVRLLFCVVPSSCCVSHCL